jgi:peptidyl-prolyl cis-trans isomerase B (cyclophilin B)
LGLFVFTVAGGCSHSDSGQSPAANLNGTKSGTPSEGGSNAPGTPKATSDRQHPVVLIETSMGNITVELNREKALLTVDNFLLYVKDSFYDQTIIHQVYKGQAILAGGYGTNLLPIPKRVHPTVRNEAATAPKNLRYTIAMARFPDSVDSATSQFFINVADNSSLDYKDRTAQGYGYCVFGKVTDGMDVVDKINDAKLRNTPELDQTPAEPIIVKSIRLLR